MNWKDRLRQDTIGTIEPYAFALSLTPIGHVCAAFDESDIAAIVKARAIFALAGEEPFEFELRVGLLELVEALIKNCEVSAGTLGECGERALLVNWMEEFTRGAARLLQRIKRADQEAEIREDVAVGREIPTDRG